MKGKCKNILGVTLAVLTLGATVALAGCGNGAYKGDAITDYVSEGVVSSNGGFAVEKGDFVYFINGSEDYTESNVYGEAVKGALMRISKTDLASGNYANVKTIVPMLFVAQNFDSGIYIYGDYVYYATPTTDKNMSGEVENTWIDFKRAKLDGKEAPMNDYYFRLSSNSANYRFVEEDGVVYCLYEEDGALKSYDTKDKVSRTLVKNAKSSFFYDKNDLTNPNVYYTMSVVVDADSDYSTTATYDQLYCVNAAARVESVDKSEASYKVKGGKTYDFDASYLNEQNEEAKKNGGEATYDLADYTTYPYVNLGELVLDGIGSNASKATQFNGDKTKAVTPDGYNYTVASYQNGGVYFTRKEVAKTSSDAESTKLYYLSDANGVNGAEWDAVGGNASDKINEVARNSQTVASAVFTVDNSGAHSYYYVANETLYKSVAGGTPVAMTRNGVSSVTLWKTEGDFLYYYEANTAGNGNSLTRINVTGSAEDYNVLLQDEKTEYQPMTVVGVEWNSSWYKPEIFGTKLLYSNEQAFGSTSYNYIYAANLPATQAEIKALNEKYEAVQDAIDEYSDNAELQAVMRYYFRTGKTTAYDAVKDLYEEDSEQKYFQEFVNKFSAETDKLERESYFFDFVGKMKAEDITEIDEAWVDSLRSEKEEDEEDNGLPTWAIVLIIVGSVLVVAAAVTVPLCIVLAKKKAKAKAAEETVNAYKRKKIDTTDDKSIDVYADEETEETKAVETTETTETEETEAVETTVTTETTETEEKKEE